MPGLKRFAGGQVYYCQLLPNGNVLICGPGGNSRILEPSDDGTYKYGAIRAVQPAPYGALYGQVWITNEGNMIQTPGEYDTAYSIPNNTTGIAYLGGYNCQFDVKKESWTVNTGNISNDAGTGSVENHLPMFVTDDGRLYGGLKEVMATNIFEPGAIKNAPTAAFSQGGQILWRFGEQALALLPDGTAFSFSTSINLFENPFLERIYPGGYSAAMEAAGSNNRSPLITQYLNCETNILAAVGGSPWRTPYDILRQRWLSEGPAVFYEQGPCGWMPKIQRVVFASGIGYVYTVDPFAADVKASIALGGTNPMSPQHPDRGTFEWSYYEDSIAPLANDFNNISDACYLGTVAAASNNITASALTSLTFTPRFDIDQTVARLNNSALAPGGPQDSNPNIPGGLTTLRSRTVFIRVDNNTRFAKMSYTTVTKSGGNIVLGGISTDVWYAGSKSSTILTGQQLTLENPHYQSMDAPGCFLPNGDFVYIAGCGGPYEYGNWAQGNSAILKWTGTGNPTLWDAADPETFFKGAEYNQGLFMLPSGEMLKWTVGDLIIFPLTLSQRTPHTTPVQAAPVLSSFPAKVIPGNTYRLTGTRVNGVNEGGLFGDDKSPRTNFPIVRLASTTTNQVVYCRSFDFEYRGISPTRVSSFSIEVPYKMLPGVYNVQICANGCITTHGTQTIVSPVGNMTSLMSRPNSVTNTVRVGASGAAPSFPYPLNGSCVFVSNSGSDSNPGTISRPKLRIASAIAACQTNGTVVVRGGTYYEGSLTVQGKSITIQNYPGEEVWVDGSSTHTNPSVTGSARIFPFFSWQTPVLANDAAWPQVSTTASPPANAFAGWPEMVWNGTTELTQVADITAIGVTPNSFYADRVNNQLVLALGTGATVITVAGKVDGLFVDGLAAAGTKVKGINFRKFATTMAQQAAVKLFATGCVMEDCIVEDTANSGIYISQADNVIVRNCTVRRAGQIGIGAYRANNLRLEANDIVQSNNKTFAAQHATGGIKITNSRPVLVQDNVINGVTANGIWFDQSCVNGTVYRNYVKGATRNGIEIEISASFNVHGNVVHDCGTLDSGGILINESHDCDVWHNTIHNCGPWGFRIMEGGRVPTSPPLAGDLDARYPNDVANGIVTWQTTVISFCNNVVSGAPSLAESAFVGYEDTSNTTPYNGRGLVINGNRYWSAAVSNGASGSANTPRWAMTLETAAGNAYTTYNNLAAIQGTGFEVNGQLSTGATNPFISAVGTKWLNPSISNGRPLISNVANQLGLPTNSTPTPGFPYNFRWVTMDGLAETTTPITPPSGNPTGPTPARLFYGGTGIFNTPIANASVQVHPRSAAIVATLGGAAPSGRGLTIEAFAITVVDWDNAGKTYQLIIRNDSIYAGAQGGSGQWGFNNATFLYPTVKIQSGVTMPSGTDAPLAIRDYANDRVISLWICEIDEAASKIYAHWGGVWPANGDGISYAPNYSPGPYQQTQTINRTTGAGAVYGHTAVGTCGYQGGITFEDLERGVIDHALCFATEMIAGPPQSPGTAFYFPATTNDGSAYGNDRIEAGARIQLQMSDSAINSISHPGQRLMARALKDYGAFVTDYAGAMMTYGCVRPRPGNAYEIGLYRSYGWESGVTGGTDGWMALNQIDWTTLRVLIPA
jgi:hypothetical protein